MRKIYALTDYKGNFGSKWKAEPYRSGFDKELLKDHFEETGYDVEFVPFNKINQITDWFRKMVIYTSSEERGMHYKDFIEDVILHLKESGADLLPPYAFLRANNNKVFMELIRDRLLAEELSGLISRVYGTLEELKEDMEEGNIHLPVVIKQASGAMSRGVYLAKTKQDLLNHAKKVSKTATIGSQVKELIREKKHKGYRKESSFQKKFIVQPFIPGLKNDWKILIFGDRYYILKRGIKENDFRASGSGYNYKAGKESGFPEHLLDKVEHIYKKLNVPHLSLDIAFDGKRLYVIEFQAVYFGTATHEFCNEYFIKRNDDWITEPKDSTQEEEYVHGIVHFLDRRKQGN